MGCITCKFGGSSVATADQIRKVEKIIRADERRRYIVVSAPGKRSSEDEKITDLLLDSQALASAGNDCSSLFIRIRERYTDIARALGCGIDISAHLEEVEQALKHGESRDYAGSRGEHLNARIIADYLGATFVEAGDGIFFREDGSIDQKTDGALGELLQGKGLFVIPGFYGTGPDGRIKIFSRGGSDITGALVARASGSDVYENWTDVSGLLMSDPRIIDNPAPVPEVTYREIRELAAMGANVFHEEAMLPVRDAGIPINIKNTNLPEHPGTMIVNEHTSTSGVAGVSGIKGITLIRVGKSLMSMDPGFTESVKKSLEQTGARVLRMYTGVDTAAFLCKGGKISGEDLKKTTGAETVRITEGIALITLVGEGLASDTGAVASVMAKLSEAECATELLDFASSGISLTVAVREDRFRDTLEAAYSAVSG